MWQVKVAACHDCSVFVLSIFHLTEESLIQVCGAKQANLTQYVSYILGMCPLEGNYNRNLLVHGCCSVVCYVHRKIHVARLAPVEG